MKLLTALFTLTLAAQVFAAPIRPNILFIMSDDLRDFGGAFTQQVAKTPNLDRLRARGVTFERAYAQYPVCNPSRTSLLTGLRCEETDITSNQIFFRDRLPDVVTLPQQLRQQGWATQAFGKIFHVANTGENPRAQWLDVGKSWDHAETVLPTVPNARQRGEVRNLTGDKLPWCEIVIMDGSDGEQPDGQTATAAIRAIETLRGGGKPWMVAAGFHRPHDPFHAPRKYFEMYPKEKLALYRDPVDMSKAAPLAISGGWAEAFAQFSDADRIDFLRAYLAGVSFMDAQVGRLLDTLDRLNLWDNTVVVFMGDHGYHLGERDWWNKNTLFERSCRAPLLIAAPGIKGGQRCLAPVELVDIYPTLADFCGVTAPHKLAGQSLRPVLQDIKASHKAAAFTLITRGAQKFGQSVRTTRWRLTRWSDSAVELYDHNHDPEETRDVASNPANSAVVAELKNLLATLPPWPGKR